MRNFIDRLNQVARDIILKRAIPHFDEQAVAEIDIGLPVPLLIRDNRRVKNDRLVMSVIKACPMLHYNAAGKLLFAGLSLGNLTTDEGEEWMIKTLFDTLVSPAGIPTFYELGLLSAPARGAEAEGDTAAGITEVVGNGYARVQLAPGSGNDFITSQDGGTSDWQADTGTRTFTASAGSPLPWTTATQIALFNPDGPEVLIALTALAADRTLVAGGDRIDTSLIIRIREAA